MTQRERTQAALASRLRSLIPTRDRYRKATPDGSYARYRTAIITGIWIAGITVGAAGLFIATIALRRVGVQITGPVTATYATMIVVGCGLVGGLCGAGSVLATGQYWLRYRREQRRRQIARTLPATVRYLRVLVDGIGEHERRFGAAAAVDAHGATGDELRRVVTNARLTGSFDHGLREIARETPSHDRLAPFLLKYIEHARQSERSLRSFLTVEARMQTLREERQRQRTIDSMELIAELFVVLLVLPAVLLIVLIVVSMLSPALTRPVWTPIGSKSVLVVVGYACAGGVVTVGCGATWLVRSLQPPGLQPPSYSWPATPRAILETAHRNPNSAAMVAVLPALLILVVLWIHTGSPLDAIVLTTVSAGVPIGVISIRRRRLDTAKDRTLGAFIHAVAGHVRLGTPLSVAVSRVGTDLDHGPLQEDIDRLSMRLQFITPPANAVGVRTAALNRFVADVGTALAAQSIGLLCDAIRAGSAPKTVLETLQTEVGRLYQEKRALQSTMAVYTIIGWTTGLLIVAIMAIISTEVFASFEPIESVSGGFGATGIQSGAFSFERGRSLCYLVTQSTMLSCGLFAGGTTGDRYESLFHASLLLAIGYVVFTVGGIR